MVLPATLEHVKFLLLNCTNFIIEHDSSMRKSFSMEQRTSDQYTSIRKTATATNTVLAVTNLENLNS